jgi:hypothetical protein
VFTVINTTYFRRTAGSVLYFLLLSASKSIKTLSTTAAPAALYASNVIGRTRVDGIRKYIFGKAEKEKRERRKLHKEECHDVYVSLNIMRSIKSRTTRWAEHVARMGAK